ncbi:hypothetical protein J4455_04730 [Candidatus Woesearchaeota archaeon]|nr:hypothetical protein [Candidatus Woesearchaeota archaeon]
MDTYSETTYSDRKNGFRLTTEIRDCYSDSNATSARVTTYLISENGNTKYATEVMKRLHKGSPRVSLSGTLEDAVIAHFKEVEDLRRNVGRNPRFSEIRNWDAADFTIKHEGERRDGIK